MTISRVNFVTVPVEDQDRALRFYRDALGFEVTTDAPYGEGWRWILLSLPGGQTRLNFGQRENYAVTGVPALTLVCDDVDAEVARLRPLEVAVTDGPRDAPWTEGVRYVMLQDTEGNAILLESRAGA